MTWDVLHENNVLGTATPEVLATVAVFSALALANRVGTVVCSVLLLYAFSAPQYPALQRLISGSRVSSFQRSRLRAPQQQQRRGQAAAARAGAGTGAAGDGTIVPNPMSVLPVAGQPPPAAPQPAQADGVGEAEGGPGGQLVDEWDDPEAAEGGEWGEEGAAGMELELATLPVPGPAEWR